MRKKHLLSYFKIFQLKILWVFIFLLTITQGCQEYIHDSFDTFRGVIVAKNGDPIPNLRLRFYSESALVSTFTTGNQGEFKIVLPSKNLDNFYRMTFPESFLVEINQFDQVFVNNSLRLDSSLRDQDGVIDLGKVILVQQ